MSTPGAGPPPTRTRWLTRDLLVRLVAALAALGLAALTLGAWSARALTDRIYDHWLLDGARALSSLVVVHDGTAGVRLSPEAERVLLFDDIDRTWFAVTQDDRLLAGRLPLPREGARHAAYAGRGDAFDAHVEGLPVRVAEVRFVSSGAAVRVAVAETLNKRERTRQRMLTMLWPFVALAVVAVLAVVLAVRRTVQPIEAIAERWNVHSHASLEAIDVREVPRELLPFATALNDLLERLRTMLTRERQFAATAAHQLRTPLTGLKLGLARAAAAPDLVTARAVMRDLERLTQRTARMAQQLLVLGRLDPEFGAALERSPVDLQQLAEDAGAAHMDQALAADVELSLTPPDAPIVVAAQPELLAEALTNLIDNAIASTPRGGRVAIEFEPHPPAIRVVDSGPGIPPHRRAALRERFVRDDTTREGSGLGLAIASDVAALHGGALELGDSPWGGLAATLRLGER